MALLTLAISIVTMGSISVYAASMGSTAPDFNWGGGETNNNADFMLVRSANTGDMSYMQLPIYFKNKPTANVTLSIYSMERGGPGGTQFDQFVEITAPSSNTNRYNAQGNFTIDKDAFSIDNGGEGTDLWRAIVGLRLRNGDNSNPADTSYRNRIAFKLRVPNNGIIGTATGNNNGYISTVAENVAANHAYKFKIPLATPCRVESEIRRTISLYDLDSGHVDNGGRTITVNIRNSVSGNVISNSSGVYNLIRSGSLGDVGTYNLTMDFQPKGKYYLEVSGVDEINMVQYKIPFDTGNFETGCPVQQQYDIVHTYTAPPATTLPNHTATYTWGIKNNGPDSVPTNYNINGTRDVEGRAVWTSGTRGNASSACYATNGLDVGSTIRGCTNTFTIPAGAIPLTNYCQRLEYRPDADNVPGWHRTGNVCTQVPYNYTLRPFIGINPIATGQLNGPVKISPSILNSRTDGTRSEPITWQVHQLLYAPGANHDTRSMQKSTNPACAHYTGESSCTRVASAHGVTVNPGTLALTDPAFDTVIQEIDAGTEVCYSLSITKWQNIPGSSAGSDWRHTPLACFTVAKTPKLQVRGGDVRVHGNGTAGTGGITTSNSSFGTPSKTYGSWTEYGAISNGANISFASGAGLLAGHASSVAAPAPWSQLTLSNVRVVGVTKSVALGGYTLGLQSQNLRTYFNSLPATGAAVSNLTVSIPGNLQVYDFGTADVSLTSVANPAGSYIIRTTGTVTIDSNITLDTDLTLGTISQIPQVVIAAGNITVSAAVYQVDAWLLASNQITTCPIPTGVPNPPVATNGLALTDCAIPLTINGPVQAKTVHFYRTAGGDSDQATQAAETINFSGYAYLWLKQLQTRASHVVTTYSIEKPPRF
ncbi:MAG: hypothetical protein ACSLEY_01815 [Candidatus Saccharimonadales bacterium]